MLDVERRTLIHGLEVRADGDDDETRKIVGHAAVFDKLSENLGGFREKIAPGTFAEAIKNDDVRALFNHDPSIVLGRNKAGTLRMSEDKVGLRVEIDPPDTAFARDLLESIDRGDISQMSFGFRALDEDFERLDGEIIRTLKRVSLFDVSPVTFPAFPDTDVSVAKRSLEAWRKRHDDADRRVANRREAEIRAARTRTVLASI